MQAASMACRTSSGKQPLSPVKSALGSFAISISNFFAARVEVGCARPKFRTRAKFGIGRAGGGPNGARAPRRGCVEPESV